MLLSVFLDGSRKELTFMKVTNGNRMIFQLFKSNSAKIVLCTLISVISFGCAPQGDVSKIKNQMDSLESQIIDLQSDLSSIRSDLDGIKQQLDPSRSFDSENVYNKLDDIESRVESLESRINY